VNLEWGGDGTRIHTRTPFHSPFHEMTHIELRHTFEAVQDSESLPRSLKEAEAECVALLRWKSLGSTSVLKDLVSSMTIDRRWKNSPKSTKFTQRQNYLCLLCLFWLFTLCAKWNPPLEMIGRIG